MQANIALLGPRPLINIAIPGSHDAGSAGRRSSRAKKNARVSGGLRVHWDRFVRKLGSGTAPSTSSNFDESVGESSGYPRSRQEQTVYPDTLDERVDEVVVDREWSDEIKSSSVTHSEHGGTPEKSGSNHLAGTNTDRDSFAVRPEGFWGLCRPLIYLRWRLWPLSIAFFYTRFLDEKSEMLYNKENWFLRKVSVLPVIFFSSPPPRSLDGQAEAVVMLGLPTFPFSARCVPTESTSASGKSGPGRSGAGGEDAVGV